MSSTPAAPAVVAIQIDESRVRQIAEQSITATLNRHGIERSDLKQESIDSAYAHARETVTAEAQRQADPFWQEKQRLKEEMRLLKMQNQALLDGRQNAATAAAAPNTQVSVDVARARAGEYRWNVQYGNAERLAAIGIEPGFDTAQNRAEAKELFGSGADSGRANDLAKRDMARYRKLREYAKAIRLI